MASPRNRVVDYAVYLLCRLGGMFIVMGNVAALYAAARRLGSLLYHVDARHARLAREQIRLSFPDWDDRRVRRVAKQSVQSVVMLGLEVLLTPRLVTMTRWSRHLRLADVDRVLRPLVCDDSAVILLTGHIGNWEVGGYALATLGFPAVAVARPLDNPYLDRFVRGVRERTGLRIVDKKGASGPAQEVLENSGTLCLIADQDAGRKGLFVDFFGRPASTYRMIALLAIRYNVPIAVGYARRLGDRFCFEVGISRVIKPDQWADKDDQVLWITQTFTTELEDIIRSDPGQYFGWLHHRWRHRPDGSKIDRHEIA